MYKNFSKIYDDFMENCEYKEWIKQIYEILEKYNKQQGSLIDIGCGTGEMLKIFSEKYNCSGMDISEEMLKIAYKKLKGKNISFFQGDMRDFNTWNKYDIAVSLFDTVNHITSLEDLISHLNSVKKQLKDDGIYIFDVIDRNFMNEMFKGGVHVDKRKNLTVIWEHDVEDGIDYIDATYYVKNKSNTFDKLEEYYEKKIFTEEEIKKCVQESKLILEEIVENKDIAGTRYFYVIKNRG
ncbi:MAG: class I SAM-dependent DNA methyltransferase [Fusobacteriaceae bacterium]